MNALIQVQNLGKSFGGHAVFHSVSFEVHASRHLALLGPSGCGKSTLLRLIAGLDTMEHGQIWLNGQLVSEPGRILVPPHQRGLAMVFQDLALWPTLTAFENVLLGMARSGLARRQREKHANEALERCKVGELASRKPAALSIGQQQRVALARAIASRPRLLVLDEPFSSLDPGVKENLLDEIRTLARDLGMTVLLVTHDIGEALTLCRDCVVIEDGNLKEAGELHSLLAAPESAFLRVCARQLEAVAAGRLALNPRRNPCANRNSRNPPAIGGDAATA